MGPPTEATQHWKVLDLLHPDTLEWNQNLIKLVLPNYEEEILNLRPSKKNAPDI